ncbi:MAG: flavin reductase family protein [Candidatus Dadabacteria bacterium]|nr:MAG: flavin reductase family protein [Candidatus Dadabacteria bacterium]
MEERNNQWDYIDLESLSVRERYKILISTILPRPIALISTVSSEGAGNLAPFSFFNGVSSNPPAVMLSFGKRYKGDKKDTLRNILETKEFVINTVHKWMLERVVACAAEYPYGVSEMEKTGLTPLPSKKVAPPRVKESLINFECKLLETINVGSDEPGSSTVVIGKIEAVHINKKAYDKNGRISPKALEIIGRLGGISYAELGEIYSLAVPALEENQ